MSMYSLMATIAKQIWYCYCNLERALNPALSDLLAQFPSKEQEALYKDLPGEEVCMVKDCEWSIHFDGSPMNRGGRAEIVLHAPDDTDVSLSFKLDISCSNNETEYEATVIGIFYALQAGIQRLHLQGDSMIIIDQVTGEHDLKKLLTNCTSEADKIFLKCLVRARASSS